MSRRLVMATCVASAILATSASAKGPFGIVRVGNWQGGAFTDDAGKFSHCAASAIYESGILFMVVFNPRGSWALSFLHKDWDLKMNDVFPIDLTFDGQERFHVFGKVVANEQVVVPMPTNSALMAQFRKSSHLSATAKGQLFQFKLTGTAQLMSSLQNCVATVKQNGIASAGDFTVTPRPKAQAARTAEPGSPVLQPAVAQAQVEAIELASNFVLKTALANPRVLSRAETPADLATGAAWRSDDASGFVRIIPTAPGTKGLDVTAVVIAGDAKECKGKFASARKSHLVDSDVVFEGMVSCEESEGARLAHYFIVPRAKGGFVMFSVIANMKSESQKSGPTEERLDGFRKAALIAVNR